MTTSIARRKPPTTFKSPAIGDAPVQQVARTPGLSTQPKTIINPRPSTRASSTSTDTSYQDPVLFESGTSAGARKKYHMGPPLPLYHPMGRLALSLPELDPADFGLPSSLMIDDGDLANDAGRRASSRARRPAPKVREREQGDDADPTAQGNAPNGAVESEAGPRERSPRKRRGGGGKRKRKEADDGDGVYPPPAKRTRNPRGTGNTTPSVASPLVSAAVVAGDVEASSTGVSTPAEGAEADEGQAEAPAIRNTRTRRPRAAANKRRHSSASETTTTSVSVSIAANAKNTRNGKAEVRAPSQDTALDATNGVQKKEEEEPEDEHRAAAAAPTTTDVQPNELAAIIVPEPKNQDQETTVAPPAEVKGPLPAATTATTTQVGEEREEGELSDDLEGISAPIA